MYMYIQVAYFDGIFTYTIIYANALPTFRVWIMCLINLILHIILELLNNANLIAEKILRCVRRSLCGTTLFVFL